MGGRLIGEYIRYRYLLCRMIYVIYMAWSDGVYNISFTILFQVIRAFHISFDAPIPENLQPSPTNSEFLNMADISVRRLVKMSKHLPRFKNLDPEDQVVLLKGAVLEVLVLRSVKIFDPKGQTWTLQKVGSVVGFVMEQHC